jgi:hypothetical protein
MTIVNKISQMVSAPILKVPLNKWRTRGMKEGEGFTDGYDNETG